MTRTYDEALEAIHRFDDPYQRALRDHGKQTWGLRGIRMLLEKIGDPQAAYPTIHIAGTKGKGSTAAFIAQGLIESGLKTGLYTSPHLQDWRERIQIDRQLIPREALAALVDDLLPHTDDMPLTAFEITTALAFWHFAREGCDAAVIEVGLGGRLDATNVITPLISVITHISLDHTQLLGDTLPSITYEKAAIIKHGVPVVSAPQEPSAARLIEKTAEQQHSPLVNVGKDWWFKPVEMDWDGTLAHMGTGDYKLPVEISLPGPFQIENAAVALAALNAAGRQGLPVTRQGRLDGLANTTWPGRLELVQRDPHVVLDSAHNVHSITQLVEALRALATPEQARGRRVVVFGCMADKDVEGMLRVLVPAAHRLILTQADSPRAASVEDLLAVATGLAGDLPVEFETAGTTASAVQMGLGGLAGDDLLCITGSLSIAGEARDVLVGAAAPGEQAGVS